MAIEMPLATLLCTIPDGLTVVRPGAVDVGIRGSPLRLPQAARLTRAVLPHNTMTRSNKNVLEHQTAPRFNSRRENVEMLSCSPDTQVAYAFRPAGQAGSANPITERSDLRRGSCCAIGPANILPWLALVRAVSIDTPYERSFASPRLPTSINYGGFPGRTIRATLLSFPMTGTQDGMLCGNDGSNSNAFSAARPIHSFPRFRALVLRVRGICQGSGRSPHIPDGGVITYLFPYSQIECLAEVSLVR